jgi:hypothetical protein
MRREERRREKVGGRTNDARKRKRMEDGVEALLEKGTGTGEREPVTTTTSPRARARAALVLN